MKILYLCPDLGIPVLGRKGASVHVRELIAAFARAGHRVTLAAQSLTKSPTDTRAKVRARVIQVPADPAVTTAAQLFKEFNECLGVENSLPGELRRVLYNKQLARGLKPWLNRNRPAFIYERASLYATAGARLAEKFHVPHIVELNAPLAVEQTAYRSTGFGNLAAEAERWTLMQADAVVVVSAELARHVSSLGVPKRRIQVMPNGVDPDLFHPRPPDRGKSSVSPGPVLGFVGGLRPWHGVEILPKLLARLSRSHPDLRLVIAGDGQLRGELERSFQQRGLQRKVTFTGALLHESVPDIIRGFDIALAPYPRHNHDFYFSPLKLFEYMACGAAVVAADVGQISDVVTNGRTGLLYPPGDFNALLTCCERLLAKPELRSDLGQAAAKLVRRKFTWDHNAERVVKLAKRLRTSRRK